MKQGPQPPRLVVWWEGLETWAQIAIYFPIFAAVTFVINFGPFSQPVPLSILYGLFRRAVPSRLLAA